MLADQRGALRDAACDSGAFEYAADDRYEISGASGTDDSCPGHRILFDTLEDHLHTSDVDWLRFKPEVAGATYEIETSGLLGTTDTILTLYGSCGAVIDENDDIGPGDLASKIT